MYKSQFQEIDPYDCFIFLVQGHKYVFIIEIWIKY